MILNLMLGRKAGGLEQAAVDYAEALRLGGLPSLTITAPDAWANAALMETGIATAHLGTMGAWDPIAAFRLRRLAKKHGATAVICHGNRALSMALKSLKGRVPIIAVAHNYLTKRFDQADACFCITEHARAGLEARGIAAEKLIFMPNMVREVPPPSGGRLGGGHQVAPNEFHNGPTLTLPLKGRESPVIGSMGRFVAKKGFSTYLDALAILKNQGARFHAVLGGGGELEAELKAQLAALNLTDTCTMTGWVGDKSSFYAGLDLFILPSRHEPFGIVLIEAMAHGVPVISTAAEGPREILRDGENGLLVPIDDAAAMAAAIAKLLADPALAQRISAQAREDVAREYSMQAMARRLQFAIFAISKPHDTTQFH